MHSTGVHKVVALMISYFYLIGFWHRGDMPRVGELRVKFFYSVYYLLFVVSLVVGAIKNENRDKAILLAEVSIEIAVLVIKLWILIWKQTEILDLLNRVCVFSIQSDDDHNKIDDKLRRFAKFVVTFVVALTVGGSSLYLILPFLGSEKTLFLEIAFPMDYKNNELAFWIATFFMFTEVTLTLTTILFSTIIWYLLFVCSLRHGVLGSELKRMGRASENPKLKMTDHQKHFIYFEDLRASIDAHLHLRELTDELGSYFSNVFFIQFGRSGLCICGSIYCLAFDIGDNLLERLILLTILFYFIADVFMVTYFGNEIKLSSGRLSYSLFESKWYEQPQYTKKCVIVFGEYLKKPQEIMVGKLYALTLETFTRIINSAYSMFNILKSFEQ